MKINPLDIYITPSINISSTLEGAKEFIDNHDIKILFREQKQIEIADIIQSNRNLIVGEPGIGKTLLLLKIQEHLNNNNTITELIYLKYSDAIDRIDAFVRKTDSQKALLLDGFDEIPLNLFPSLVRKIETISIEYPDLPIYPSSRWIFINRYATSFPGYRFIAISHFSYQQVKKYLLAKKHCIIRRMPAGQSAGMSATQSVMPAG